MRKIRHKNIREKIGSNKDAFTNGGIFIKLSLVVMGIANIWFGQFVKGLAYLCIQIAFICFMISSGITNLMNVVTLGTMEQGMVKNSQSGMFELVKGDNSMKMLLAGVATVLIITLFIIAWIISIKSGINTYYLKKNKKAVPGIKDDIRDLFDVNIHRLLLFLPVVGLIVLTILPLIYMITMAFTNYDVNHQPPGNLFTWVGLKNFKLLLFSDSGLSKTFWPILSWTIIWAIFATFTNYFGGMFLAILINKKQIRFKKLWRTIFVLTISIPGFIGLLIMRTMLNEHGIINILLQDMGFIKESLPFLTNETWARVTVIVVNMWIGIPFTMLITTGILMNIPEELYESAKIDGASQFKIFVKITFPYIIYITTPYLIANFIANVNNFNPIYFLTAGGPYSLQYYKGAGKTDLLVTWLYKLTAESKNYNYAATIGIIIFIISATISLLIFRRTATYKDKGGFQ